MSDLVKRLIDMANDFKSRAMFNNEANALKALERIKVLEAGLKPFAEAAKYFEPEEQEGQVLDDDHMIADVITCDELSELKRLTARVEELEKENARLDRLARPCLSKKARASLGEMCEAMEAMDDDTTDGTALRMLLEWHDRRAAAAMEK